MEHADRKATIEVQGRFNLNNPGLMQALCERHPGIGALAPQMTREALDAGRLVPVLAEWRLERLPVQAVTASRQQPATVKALVAFLASRLDTR